MSNETRKALHRRLHDPLYHTVFSGHGIDIGCGPDPLCGPFAKLIGLTKFDKEQGDAQFIGDYLPEGTSFDFVYSSHCLEHMHDPAIAIRSWFELVRPGGYMVIVVPDEDLYEQGQWPSIFNSDHKWSFTICKAERSHDRSVNMIDLLMRLQDFQFVRIALIDEGYDYSIKGVVDQSLGPAEVGIEAIVRKLF